MDQSGSKMNPKRLVFLYQKYLFFWENFLVVAFEHSLVLAIFCSKVFTSDHPLLQFSFWICVFLPLSIVKNQCSISSQEQKENIPYLGHYFWNEFRENWLEPVTFRCEIICKEHKITEHHSSAVFAK